MDKQGELSSVDFFTHEMVHTYLAVVVSLEILVCLENALRPANIDYPNHDSMLFLPCLSLSAVSYNT